MAGLKFKEVQDRAQGSSWLTWTTDKKILLDYRQAQRLACNDHRYFLPFSFVEKGARTSLFYFTTDTYPLSAYLNYALSRRTIAGSLQQVVKMLDGCVAKGYLPGNVFLDPERVFIDSNLSRLKFIYLPVTGYQAEDRQLLNFLISLVGRTQPKNEDAAVFIAALLDYLKKQEVFSLIKLKSVLGMDDREAGLKAGAPNVMRAPEITSNSQNLFRDFIRERRE
jgi:hypothetical protein